ncbi:MAG: glycosyltransferase family 2 protein [Candidatus Woesebacteria bacterium]|nr:glycosyltransferase family 2 protein [Candidatus Woesebacteria bacterium]
MKISIIIPTYNEKKVLGACIESLGKQTFTDFEIIVVDDGSTDTTSQILRGASKTLPNLRFLTQKHGGPGAARNLGAKEAKGDILVFVDADMTFDKDFLVNLVKPIVERKTNGTFSKEEYVANWESVWARCWSINEGWEPKRRHLKKYPDHQPVFRAILKTEFDKVGGFTPGGYDDDWSLSKKLGYEAINAPDAIFYHKNPDNLIEIFEHAKWVSKRKYKLGIIGKIYNLIVYSFPDSIWQGFWKSIFKKEPFFIVFKIVYDFGAFIGILEYIFKGSGVK